MDAHKEALLKTQEFIGNSSILEITYDVPFGFHEIADRENIHINAFLASTYTKECDASVLHILLGCGVPWEKVINTINKAIKLSNRVIVLEHNRASGDWDWRNNGVVEGHFLHNCITRNEFTILQEIYNWKAARHSLVQGEQSPDRNFIVEITGKVPVSNFANKYDILTRLNIPLFRDGARFQNYASLYDVYIGTAESQSTFLRNIEEKIPNRDYTLYANGGGFFSLNYMHFLRDTRMNKIVLFDINSYTVEFAKTVFTLIKTYPTVAEFLSNYLLCNVTNSGADCKIVPTEWVDRIKLYMKNHHLYNDVSKQVFQLFLNGHLTPDALTVYGFRNCANNDTRLPGKLTLTHDQDDFVDSNTLSLGRKGWLESEQSYKETRNLLLNTPIEFLPSSIDKLTPAENDIVTSSNILKEREDKKIFNCKIIQN